MKKLIEEFKRSFILLAAASLVLGILFLVTPRSSGLIICYICGGALLVAGIWNAVVYFRRTVEDSLFRRELVWGVIEILAGVYIIARPQLLLGFLPVAMGLVMIYDALTKLQSAMDLLRMRWPYWWTMLVLGGVAAVLGVVMVLNPFETADVLVRFCGGALVVNAAMDLWTVWCVTRRVKQVVRTIRREVCGIEVEDYVIAAEGEEPAPAAPEEREESGPLL